MGNVLRSGRMLQGHDIPGLEGELATRCHRQFGIGVGSCTDALFFSLLAIGVRPGDEVLVTDFSFIASASCIHRLGAVPRFVDVDPESGLMDLRKAEQLVTPSTTAILAVQLFGRMIPPGALREFALTHRLAVLEDAAQSLGSEQDGIQAGSMGLASCLSFDPTKNLSAPGSGGMVLTDDSDVASRIRSLRYHGLDSCLHHVELGYNSQMPSLTAAVLRIKLRHFDELQQQRSRIAERYRTALQGLPVLLPQPTGNGQPSWHKFVIRSERRDLLQAFLTERGIATKVHYPMALRRHPMFQHADPASPPWNSDRFAATAISLPIYPFMTHGECEHVIGSVHAFFDRASN